MIVLTGPIKQVNDLNNDQTMWRPCCRLPATVLEDELLLPLLLSLVASAAPAVLVSVSAQMARSTSCVLARPVTCAGGLKPLSAPAGPAAAPSAAPAVMSAVSAFRRASAVFAFFSSCSGYCWLARSASSCRGSCRTMSGRVLEKCCSAFLMSRLLSVAAALQTTCAGGRAAGVSSASVRRCGFGLWAFVKCNSASTASVNSEANMSSASGCAQCQRAQRSLSAGQCKQSQCSGREQYQRAQGDEVGVWWHVTRGRKCVTRPRGLNGWRGVCVGGVGSGTRVLRLGVTVDCAVAPPSCHNPMLSPITRPPYQAKQGVGCRWACQHTM